MKKTVGIRLMFTVLLFLTMAAYSAAQPALQPSSVPGIMVQEGFDAEIFVTGLNLPVKLAIESNGSVLVMAASNCSFCPVVRLSCSGNVIASSEPISDPDGVVVDSLGQVFVAGGTTITLANSLDLGPDADEIFATGFSNLNGIAIDSADRIVVVENDGRIREVTAAGAIVEPPLASLGFYGNPIAFDASNRLFAGRWDPSGTNGELFLVDDTSGSPPPPPPISISNTVNAVAIAVGSGTVFGDDIYSADFFTGDLHKVDKDTGAAAPFAAGFDAPAGLVFVGTEALLVSEMNLGRIIRIFPDPDDGPIASDLLTTVDDEPTNLTPVDGMLTLTAFVSDIDSGNSNIAKAEYSFDGGCAWYLMTASDGGYDQPSEDVTATFFAPSTAGVYDLCVRATDDVGNTGPEECMFLVVYDPDGGYVTGGGWIDSPEGAYVDDPALTGKANFGFVSKYKQGAHIPTGETEFQFKVADLNFHSDNYDWLVAAGSKAKYKGTGTINRSGNYGFMLSAIDEKLTPSTDVDLFRIKIWDKDAGDAIVYDNNMGDAEDDDPTTEIGGGSIVIHKTE